MKEYIHKIIIPYVTAKQKYLKLQPNHTALAIYDESKGRLTPAIFSLLEAYNVVVKVPTNCTDKLQPMNLSVNKAVKDFLRKRFQIWYSHEVEKLYRATAPGHFTPVVYVQVYLSHLELNGFSMSISIYRITTH